MAFPVYNVNFKKAHLNNIMATGEIMNETHKDYIEALFKIKVFDRSSLLGEGVIRVHDFRAKAVREFETFIEGIDYKVIPAIFRYEVLFEGGY